jgi:hypothetical protein
MVFAVLFLLGYFVQVRTTTSVKTYRLCRLIDSVDSVDSVVVDYLTSLLWRSLSGPIKSISEVAYEGR